MITIDSLTVRYGPQTVLDNLTMHLSERSVHGLVGVNGAGKTTLFDTFFYDGMTGRDLLDLTAHYNPSSDPAVYVRVFGLPVDRPVAGWSAGMKRKLALTVTLMQQKPLLLLDEPFNGLDMESLHAARQLILRRREAGATVIVSSHLLETLSPLCDDIHLLDNGRIATVYRREEYPRAANELEELFHRHYLTRLSDKPS